MESRIKKKKDYYHRKTKVKAEIKKEKNMLLKKTR